MVIRNKDELTRLTAEGEMFDYLYFWGHRPPKTGISKSCFSQWYEASFKLDGVIYPTAEHYMMARKAEVFGDRESLERVIRSPSPAAAKKLGRQVKGFDNQVWLKHRFNIVVQGNIGKFSANLALKDFLLGTGERVLVEASPTDRIWGIGLAADHPDAGNPDKWKGDNLLGFALMVVRRRLRQ